MNEVENLVLNQSPLLGQNIEELSSFSFSTSLESISNSNRLNLSSFVSPITNNANATINDWQTVSIEEEENKPNQRRYRPHSFSSPFESSSSAEYILIDNQHHNEITDIAIDNRYPDEITGVTASSSSIEPQYFGNIDGTNKTLRLTDSFGVEVAFVLTGNGYGEVVGTNNFEQIILHDTDTLSQLVIRTTQENTETTVGDIIVHQDLGQLTARTTDLVGDINIGGIVTKIVLDDVIGNFSTIEIENKNSRPLRDKATIVLSDVENLNFISQQVIESLTANQWLNTDNTAENIIARKIEKLNIGGDLQANLQITGINNDERLVLEDVTVRGIAEGVWQIEDGRAGIISINNTSDSWYASFEGQIVSLVIEEDLRGVLVFPNSAEDTYIEVGRDIINATILSGADLGDDNQLGGVGEDADTFSDGGIKRIKVRGNVVSSIIGAGLNPVDGIFNNGNEIIEGGENSVFDRFSARDNVSSDSLIAGSGFNLARINGTDIDVETDDRFLTPSKVPSDITPPTITTSLQLDTGEDNSDGITNDATITGIISDESSLSSVIVDFIGSTQTVDIIAQINADGSFTLDSSELQQIRGDILVDGDYQLNFTAVDSFGNTSSQSLNFSYDTSIPELELITPIAQGIHSQNIPLLGNSTEEVEVTIVIDGGTPIIFTSENNGDEGSNNNGNGLRYQFQQDLPNLSIGNHTALVTVTDKAGNMTVESIDFTVGDNIIVAPNNSNGWGIKSNSNDSIVLGERDSYVIETSLPIQLGLETNDEGEYIGSRTVSFDVSAIWDTSDSNDNNSAVNLSQDRLLVYLVDSNDSTQTLLDNGVVGTPIFTLTEEDAQYPSGLVTFDGQKVNIDVTSLTSVTTANLVFQLVNQDSDVNSVVSIDNLTNVFDEDGVEKPVFPITNNVVNDAGELDLTSLSLNPDVEAVLSKVQIDLDTGKYQGLIKVVNNGEAIGRNVVVVVKDLPTGVELVNASGIDSNGNPYLNLRNAIVAGGLDMGAMSKNVTLEFDNPNNLPFSIVTEVLTGGTNSAPVWETILPLSVMPGEKLTVPLVATDSDGDEVTFRIENLADLPTGMLTGGGNLVFTPTPDEIGSYSFNLIATDGNKQVSQTVTLDVVADTDTTTRISGVVLDTDGTPLAGVPIKLSRITTLTNADGSFTLEIPPELLPTTSFNISVPQGDVHFDPFMTGTQTIEMRRAGFDTSTGTSIDNPRRHPNLVSGFLDGSTVYGSDSSRANALRTLDGTGKLKTSTGDLLPFNTLEYFPDGMLENDSSGNVDPQSLFVAGDVRGSENPALASLHTLLVREHNRLAEAIALDNPTLTGEEIYQQARQLVSAIVQKITYDEYLPSVLGTHLTAYTGYDATVNPMASTLFSTTAFRMGHSQSTKDLVTVDAEGKTEILLTTTSFFDTSWISENGIDDILRGITQQAAQEVDTFVIDELRNFLFGPPGAGGLDLVSLGIQRGRDLGLPSYNQARIDLGLTPVTSFDQITSNVEVQQALLDTYGTVDDLDPWVGGLAEDHHQGAIVGELFSKIISEQFERLRDGDRFWYQNGQLTADDLAMVESTTLASLIERNTTITGLTGSLFNLDGSQITPTQNGVVTTGDGSGVRSYDGSGNNLTELDLGSKGENLSVDFSLDYEDGISTPTGSNRPSARVISNDVFDQDIDIFAGNTSLMGVFWGQLIAHDLSLTPTGISNTLEIHGDDLAVDGVAYPFVAEKLPLVLDHQLYQGTNNVIDRPIYLPKLDTANAVMINPDTDTRVTTANIPNAEVMVKAGSLMDSDGREFAGELSITEVPTQLTPAALPPNLLPELVVTIQPSEMVFTTPAPLTLPNTAGWAPGTQMDLWSINPTTGEFEIVGKSEVSADGSKVETITGGIRNSSWHFVAPPPEENELEPPAENTFNKDNICDTCETTGGWNSEVEFHSGAIIETHNLVSYMSNGTSKGLTLTYDSLRADPRPIIHFGHRNVEDNPNSRLVAELTLSQGNVEFQVPGIVGEQYGLDGGEHFWRIPDGGGDIDAALQVDLRGNTSGKYNYTLTSGILQFNNSIFTGSTSNSQGEVIVVNSINSPFGSGWGLADWIQLVENEDGSVLWINGDGSEHLFKIDAEGNYISPPGNFSTLEKQEEDVFRLTTREQTIYEFNQSNQLQSVTDRNSNATQYIYNQQGYLSQIIDSVGLITTFGYTNGKVTSITDPANRVTQLAYDLNGNLASITDPDETKRTWEYDAGHHMVAEIDKRGNTEQSIYNLAGRAQKAIRADGSVIQIESVQSQGVYEPQQTIDPINAPVAVRLSEAVTSYSDGSGNVSKTVLDQGGQTVSATDGGGFLPTVERNEQNLITTQTNGRGQTTTYDYDERGNVISIYDSISISNSTTETSLFPNPVYNVGGYPSGAIVSADFNKDGNIDLITPKYQDNSISLLLGNGNGTFIEYIDYPVGNEPENAYVADFNNDGNDDLVIVNDSQTNNLSILLGNGDGTFASNRIDYTVPNNPSNYLAVRDLNSDGNLDIVTPYYNYPDERGLSILLGTGDGTFVSSVEDLSEVSFSSLTLNDFDNDGDLDVAIANNSSISILLGNNDGTFATPTQIADLEGRDIRSIIGEDFNNDGNLDLVTVNSRNDSISILLNNGDSTFALAVDYSVGIYTYPYSAIATDLNNDGNLDLATANVNSNSVSVLLGNGDGTFNSSTEYLVGGYPWSITSSDFDNDGDLDLATANLYNSNISLLQGNGDGTFVAGIDFDANSNKIQASMLGDVDGNGILDLVTANSSNTISVYLGNGNGTFTQGTSWSVNNRSYDVALADLNNDGNLDVVSANGNSISILQGNGNGTFLEQVSYDIGSADTITIEDTNNDGYLDIITNDEYSGIISILRGDENDDFTLATVIDLEIQTRSLKAGDLDGDGNMDLVSVSDDDDLVSILFGNEEGTYSSPVSYQVGRLPTSVGLNDLDDDGDLDLVTTNALTINGISTVSVLLNNGDGTFGIQTEYETSGYPDDIALADIDGDNNLDIVTSNLDSYSVSILRGFGNGVFAPSLDFSVGYEPVSVSVGDLDEDGDLDIITGNFDGSISVRLNSTNDFGQNATISFNQYTYDSTFNQLTSFTDELGRVTLYEIDSNNGNLLSTTRVVGEVDSLSNNETDDVKTAYTYTDSGLIDTMTSANGHKTQYNYDLDTSNLIEIIYAVGTDSQAIVKYEYNDLTANLTAFIDENNNRTEYRYDNANRLIETTYAKSTLDEAVETMDYDFNGNLISMVDGNGNQTVYEYDEKDRLIKIIEADPDGDGPLTNPVTINTYDGNGNLISTIDPLQKETKYIYDSRNRLVEIIQPDDNNTKANYDANNNLITTINQTDDNTRRLYDSRNRLTLEIDAEGNETRYTYDGANQLIAVTDGNGHTTKYEYDELGRLFKVTDAEDNITLTEYDRVGNVTATLDGNGNLTEYEYDARNRQVLMRNVIPDGDDIITKTEYDDVGNVSSITDGENNTTRYFYDARNRQVSIKDALDYETFFDYDKANNLILVTDANTHETRYRYDSLNRQIKTINAKLDEVKITYDAVGNIIATTDELGRTTTYKYDELDRLVLVTDPNSNTVETKYDAKGNVIATIDGLDHRTEYEYDKINRLTLVRDADNFTTTYTYDAVGNLLTLTDASNNTTTYTYDRVNRLLTDTNQLGLTRTYEYDKADNLVSQTDRNDRTTTFKYDALSRVIEEYWLDDSNLIEYFYDAASRLVSVYDDFSGYEYTYDRLNRLTRVDNLGIVGIYVPYSVILDYTYDPVGNMLSVTDTIDGVVSGVESYTYDELDRVVTITQSGLGVTNKRVDFGYDKASQLKEIDRYSDLDDTQLVAESDYDYDDFGRLINLAHGNSLGVIASYNWLYDEANRIKQFTSPSGVVVYEYDDRNQLTRADYDYLNDENDEIYDYDGTGNRKNDGYVTGDNNQLLSSDGVYNYTYDNEGNRLSRTEISTGEVTQYQWDYRNRLIGVITKDVDGNVLSSVEYTYDVYNRRIAKSVDNDGDGNNDIEEGYVLDGDEIVLVFDGDGNLKERYLHGVIVDQVIAVENTDGSVNWFLADNLGSIRYVLDDDGNVINEITYDSFGEISSETSPEIDLRFAYTGRELDEETGQYYYRSRYYDSSVGRFINEDTIGFAGGDANLYRYVGNNTTNATDPTGKFANFAVQAGIGAGVDLTIQLIKHKGDFSKVDWLSVAMSGLSGALGGVVSAKAAVKFASLLQRVVVNALASGGIDAGLQVGRNALTGCNLSDNVLQQGLIGGLGGALGEIVQPLFKQLDSFIRGTDGNIDDAIDALDDVVNTNSCFIAGTLVATPDGYKAIEMLEIGDVVMSGNPESGEIASYPIENLFKREVSTVVHIQTKNNTITCSPEHPFWVVNKGWIKAGKLKANDILLTLDKNVISIESIEKKHGFFTVYNIEVQGFHTYYVSEKEILVHNKSMYNPNGGSGQFADGDVFEKLYSSSDGDIRVTGPISIENNGKTVRIEISIFPTDSSKADLGTKEMRNIIRQLADEAKKEGFEQLRITGYRTKNATFNPETFTFNPGRRIDKTINLRE